jgi:hypothetical protein
VFGWIEVNFTDDANFSVIGFAYQDNGSPIGIGVIPEPDTALLLGLGLVGVAQVARRRKRLRASATRG